MSKCEHPSCNCQVEASKRFCSDACKDLAASTQARETRCGCGHKDCASHT